MRAIFKAVLILAIQYFIPAVMRAAERKFDLPKSGEQKKAYVVEVVKQAFGALPIAEEVIDAVIEGSMNQFEEVANADI
jgi:hypothetical protein